VAPLDWGLGHATRCIPLIKTLSANGCEVVIAAAGAMATLLQQEFPRLTIIPLPGYGIRYARRPFWLPLRILAQLPKIALAIRHEHRWLKKAVSQHNIDAIVSDNRFGLHHKGLPTVYITHQLAIQTGWRFTDWLAQRWHYRFINRFGLCWVPDAEGPLNLAGRLSHPVQLPKVPVQYLGPLSRLEKSGHATKYDLLLLLSGPEPQRSILENLLLAQLATYTGKALLVRGLPGGAMPLPPLPSAVQAVNHLPAAELGQALQQSQRVVCRSGYTTVMDLVHLGKKAILIPTPGQTEQEYLAAYLRQKGLFYTMPQQRLNLLQDLADAAAFDTATVVPAMDAYQKIMAEWVGQLRKEV
jgi:UDP:flavonoid glycosyltransferase YjiC (YdhE family)